ncbi:DMT family transporter [Starkeya koreensis]|uniref:DMT family transporter n=1 Tax=Ancylobacter koreensis TaxID=266121 RepID=A0ABT0DP25_9HYPH|nr:DMT family transporter [Ancylobacter koreensis]MCK0209037.1 DMT family transporter [Ancylobacter koreensis]
MTPRDIASYVFLAVTWGASFVVMTHIIHAFGWAGSVALRSFLAAGTLFLAARLVGRKLDFSFGIRPLLVVGAFTVAAQLTLISYGLPRIGTAMSAILVATIPLFSMLIARLWRVEPIRPGGVVGIALGIIGVVLLVGFPARPVTPDFLVGCAATIASTLSAAFGSVYAGRRLSSAGSWEVTIGAFLVGGLLTLPLLAVVPIPTVPVAHDYLMLLIAGTLMSAMTYVAYFGLIASIGPTRAISVEFAVTAVAVTIGTLLLDEPLSLPQMAGAAVIGIGCALVLGVIRLGRADAVAEHPGA